MSTKKIHSKSVESVAMHGETVAEDFPAVSETARSFNKKRIMIISSLSLVVFVVVGVGGYYYLHYQKTAQLLKNPVIAAATEQKTLVAEVGQLMVLPANETPTIATVSDVTKLANQSFFAKAKNGDKVLIYPKAQVAILYDPLAHKLVNTGPISINKSADAAVSGKGPDSVVAGAATTAVPTLEPTKTVSIRVALYNGTTVNGLAGKVEQELKQKLSDVIVVAKTNANKSDYTKTLVIDLSGRNGQAASMIASTLHGNVGNLPAVERKPSNADILVILGPQ